MPALNALQEMIEKNGKYFKVAFSLSGVGMEQLELHAPQVLEKLQELNKTGCVEFLAEPYSHGLASLVNEMSFKSEVERQCTKIEEYFGKKPTVLRNSSLIYSDEIGAEVADMGFIGMLTEGAKHVLGWKSPHYVYHCAMNPKLKLLLRDIRLSDDISLRFSNSDWEGYPLFADNYMNEIAATPQEEQVINIFMELSALGIAQPLSSNILEFMKALPQHEAFNKLYSVADRVRIANDPRINQDWDYLQASNNFRFMTTKPSNVGLDRGIYSSPFDAFTNYMNILGDFISRVNNLYPTEVDNEQLEGLLTTITNQDQEIEMQDKEITRLQAKIEKIEAEVAKLRGEKATKASAKKPAAKTAAKKAPAKKTAKAEPTEEKKD